MESIMKVMLKFLGCAVVASASLATPAAAAPLAAPSALLNAVAPSVETVQWRGRRGLGWAPFAGAAIIGGAIAASRYNNYYDNYYGNYAYAPGYYGYGNSYGDYAYSPGYRYGYGNSYGDYAYAPGYRSGPSYTYESSGGGDDVAYCKQRFRSYDPASGTYMGYDGQRHPCP
jgi:BA14K-like protein